MELVNENEGIVEVCITMVTTSAGAMLAMQVDLAVSTIKDTGEIVAITHSVVIDICFLSI